jgi:hypothetical protein
MEKEGLLPFVENYNKNAKQRNKNKEIEIQE